MLTPFLILILLPLALRAEWIYRQIPALPKRQRPLPLPSLSIIIPARNEEANLRRLLPSLRKLDYAGQLEIIVVDDASEDATAVVAQQYACKVISVERLPDGWHGKPNACHQGALAAKNEWFLFTDADTCHDPCSASRAVTYALDNHLDGLSLFLRQATRGISDRIVLMAAFAGLFAGIQNTKKFLNGQYILLRRDVYEQSGGFTAVRDEALEDLALAHHLYANGYQVPIMRGDDAAEVAMYASTRHMWHGMTRLGAGSLPWSGIGSIITGMFVTGAMTPLLAPIYAQRGKLDRRWIGVSWITAVAGFIPWAQRYGQGWEALLAPFGALFVQLAAVWGMVNRVLGRGIQWKTRKV